MLLLCLITKLSMISVEELLILKDQHTLTWTDSSLKLFHPLLPPSDSMVPLTSISLNSKPILYHIQESISCFPLMLQLSLLRKLIMNNSPLLKSQTPLSNLPPWWPNVIQDTVNTWPAAWCTEVMLFQRMLTPPLLPLKPRELSSSLIGVLLVSNVVLIINLQLLFQVVISLKSWELFAWSLTLLLLLKSSPESIINSILCMPKELSFTGT